MQQVENIITQEEIRLVQQTWAQVVPKSFEVSQLFYANMFEQHPEFVPMFKTDMKQQGKKLMQMIGTVVLGLSNMRAIEPVLTDSGRKHVGYGVGPGDYQMVRDILMLTFSQAFGPAFTDEVRQAWTKVYDIMAGMMISATEEEESFLLKLLKKSRFW